MFASNLKQFIMNKFYLSFFVLFSTLTHAQNFELTNQNSFDGVFYGDCAVADFNNDGKDDFIYSGAKTGYATGNTSMYINSEDGLYLLDAGFSNILYSSIATGDLSGNGYTDFIITGTKKELDGTNAPIFEIYYNNGDLTFTKNIFSGIPHVTFGSLQIADFNNDGIQDILVNGVNGNSYISKIYFQDEDANFTDSQIPLMDTYFSDTAVFDANDDGYLDILITGFNTSYVPDAKLYINQQDGTFTEEQSGLDSVYFSSISIGDFNNDGISDVLLSGMNSEYVPVLKTYTNNGLGQFTVENTFTGTYGGSSAFVDYNSDGLLDVFSMGSSEGNQNTVLFYTNNGDGTFTADLDSASNITGLNLGSAIWFDYDNDTDKDLFTMGFTGTEGASNLYENKIFTFEEPCNQDPGINEGDTGCVTFNYAGQQVTYTTVRTAEGNIWIQQNLGSATIANTPTDENAFGDLFQWGRWDDGHQLRNSIISTTTPSPNNPLAFVEADPTFYLSEPEWWDGGQITDTWNAQNAQNVTETNGCDPCKTLGQNWRLPTPEEWQSAIDAENITNIATAFESNLKLTVAGARSNSGIYNAGTKGYYWSNSISSTNPSFAKYLYYSNAIVNTNAGGFREQGSSIRCLKMLSDDYCAVSVDFDVEPITSVSFANISNTSTATINQSPAYENFTAINGIVFRDQIYTLTVKGNTAGAFEHDIRLFIDWNQDNVFDMNTEYYATSLLPSTGEDSVTATIEVQIPSDAVLGTTRMRIIKDMWNVYEEGEFDACLNAYYGQVEDYSLTIQEQLKAVDFDKSTVKIFPNPTANFVTIQSETAIENIKVYNTLGQLIINQKDSKLNLSSHTSGIYFVQIQLENGNEFSQKIIKK